MKTLLLFLVLFFAGCNDYESTERVASNPQGIAMNADEEEFYPEDDPNDFLDNGGVGVSADNTAVSGGWSATGLLNRLTNDESVNLQVDFPESGPYTVQFSLDRGTVIGLESNAIAEIDWKVEGNWVHRAITLGDGSSISGTASAVRVVISNIINGGLPGEYRVSCQVAKGTRANNQQPPMFRPVIGSISIAPLNTYVLPIPENIGATSFYFTALDIPAGTPPLAGEFYIYLEGAGLLSAIDGVDAIRNGWIPIPPGTRQMSLINKAAAKNFTVSVTFGIDG